ncbi:hypothetical protein ACFWMP_14110 [Paenibacillus sp. NPDC058367]|uniref:hypothetical protein n=1 Tax=unclassified Paenibacillus TaxID=185978 RepID=UPI0030F87ABF
MLRDAAALNDSQIALTVKRGQSVQITLMQEETTGEDGAVLSPAKSFTVMERESAVVLRDLLIKVLKDDAHEDLIQ